MAVEIIAEAAQGFQGDPTLARLLANAAGPAGADAVKFQLVYADELATPDYQHYDLFRSLEMPEAAWTGVREETAAAGLRLYFDVFGPSSLEQALRLGADGVKIHGSDFFNAALVGQALARVPRVYVSLGGISAEELSEFLERHRITPEQPVWFLYGFQAEPTPLEANHLRRLPALRTRFPGYRFGFMDHSDGAAPEAMTLALLTLPLGVECVEKHLTLDRVLRLEDYVSALPPEGFRRFADGLRRLEAALGSADLALGDRELEYRRKAVKVVVANRAMRAGERIAADGVALKRAARPAAAGFHRVEEVAGRVLAVDVTPNVPLSAEMLR